LQAAEGSVRRGKRGLMVAVYIGDVLMFIWMINLGIVMLGEYKDRYSRN
jgi:hypothetical protein